MTALPKHDLGAEQATLGAVLLAPRPVMRALLSAGLRAEHFYRDAHRLIYEGMEALEGRGDPVDYQTVRYELDRLNGGGARARGALDECAGGVPNVANVRRYAERVIELAEWRRRADASHEMLAATEKEDGPGFLRAYGELAEATRTRRTDTYTPERWADALGAYFSQTEPQRAVPLPLARLNGALAGGLRPGEVMVVGAHTSHGKSVWVDQIMDGAAAIGLRCHAYLTEMGAVTRGLRLLSRKTGIRYAQLRARKLDQAAMEKIFAALEQMPYGITIASDWDIEEVVRDALYSRWDLVVLDLIHGFRYDDERGLDRLSKAMQRLAITSTTIEGFAGTAVIGVAHTNRGTSLHGGKRARPTLRDLKGGSSLEQDADFVNFLWLEDDERGVPSTTGEIWFAKGRSGFTESVDVELDPVRFTFGPRTTAE